MLVHLFHHTENGWEAAADIAWWDAVDDAGTEPAREASDGEVGDGERVPNRVAAGAVLGANLVEATEVHGQPTV